MTILAATDFSPCSITATRLAAAMARRRGVPLLLVNTIEPFPVDPVAAPVSGAWEGEMATAAQQALTNQADELRKSGLTIEVQVLFGSASGSILRAASDAKAELIVLGTHGRRGAARLFLGSCAEEVVRRSACPVLVTGADPIGFERWERGAPLNLTAANPIVQGVTMPAAVQQYYSGTWNLTGAYQFESNSLAPWNAGWGSLSPRAETVHSQSPSFSSG